MRSVASGTRLSTMGGLLRSPSTSPRLHNFGGLAARSTQAGGGWGGSVHSSVMGASSVHSSAGDLEMLVREQAADAAAAEAARQGAGL